MTVDGNDGVYLEFRSDSDESIYRLEIIDDAWQAVVGGETKLLLELGGKTDFTFRIRLDLDNADTVDKMLTVKRDGGANVSFDGMSGNAVVEYSFIYRKASELSVAIKSGENDVALLTTDKNGIIINGESVYTVDYDYLWYRMRFELDTESNMMSVKLNGRKIRRNALSHLLRRTALTDLVGNPTSVDNVEIVYTIDFTENVTYYSEQVSGLVRSDDGISAISTKNDPQIVVTKVEPIDLDGISYIRVLAKLDPESRMSIYYTTDSDSKWDEKKVNAFNLSSGDEELTYYYIDMTDEKNFTRKLTALRLDPSRTADTEFTVKSIEFLRSTETEKSELPTKLEIDSHVYDFGKLEAIRSESGELCIPFDPSNGMNFALNCYHTWDKDEQTLTLNFIGRTLIFRVGSNSFTVGGEAKSLGFTLEQFDGIPLLPIGKICELVGYTYTEDDSGISVATK